MTYMFVCVCMHVCVCKYGIAVIIICSLLKSVYRLQRFDVLRVYRIVSSKKHKV